MKLLAIQFANDCNGLVVECCRRISKIIAVGKKGENVVLVAPVARAKGVQLRSLPQMLRDSGGASVRTGVKR